MPSDDDTFGSYWGYKFSYSARTLNTSTENDNVYLDFTSVQLMAPEKDPFEEAFEAARSAL